MSLFHRNPPVVHWCQVCSEYLNIPVDCDEQGRRMGECPYCNELFWEEATTLSGFKGGETGARSTKPLNHVPIEFTLNHIQAG